MKLDPHHAEALIGEALDTISPRYQDELFDSIVESLKAGPNPSSMLASDLHSFGFTVRDDGVYAIVAFDATNGCFLPLTRRQTSLLFSGIVRSTASSMKAAPTVPNGSAESHRTDLATRSTHARMFDVFSLILPTRLANEEIGDAMEDIERRIARGCPAWHVWVKIISTMFWALAHAAGSIVRPGGEATGERKGAGE